MFFIRHDASLIVFKGIRQAAGLGAIATVGASARLGVGNVALPGVRHAQCAMNKEFNGRVDVVVNSFDLVEIQLTRQHDLREPDIGQKLSLFDAADIALGAGVQLNRRNVQFQHTHILNDQRVNPCLPQLVDQGPRRFQLIIMKNGVKGHENLRAITMGERHQLRDVAQAVAGIVPRAESRAADINRVGAMKDRFTGDGGVACRAQKFKMMGVQAHVL